jgi:hypothetical protein
MFGQRDLWHRSAGEKLQVGMRLWLGQVSGMVSLTFERFFFWLILAYFTLFWLIAA